MDSKQRRIASFIGIAALTLGGAACSKASPDKVQAATVGTGADIPEVLATIGNDKITLADLHDRIGDQLDQLEANYKKARSQAVETALNQMIRERVIDEEAKKSGKSINDLILAQAGGSFEPTEVEINKWYDDNKGRLQGRRLEELRPQITDLLRKQKQENAAEALQNRLDKEHSVSIKFQPYRLAFDNSGAPTLGKRGAKVTVVEFSDFQCPFCRQFAGNLREIGRVYGDRVEIVYRQYPIPSLHPFAFKAAEASLCANEQGKFWDLHDLMFTDQEHITVKDLKEKAKRLGMDAGKFDGCLDTGKYTEQVQRDMAEGTKAGVTGTPAIFVNGIEVPGGAVPYPTVAAAIDRELKRSGDVKTN